MKPRSFTRSSLPLAAALAALVAMPAARAATATWNLDTAGPSSWDANASWTAAFPNATTDTANVINDITTDNTINLNVAITLGALNIGDASGNNKFTIAAGTAGSLILPNSGTPTITRTATGTSADSITANIAFSKASNIVVDSANGALELSGLLTGGQTLTKSGAGTVILTANSYAGNTGSNLTVTAGTVMFKNCVSGTQWSVLNYGGPTLTVSGGTVDLNGGYVQVGKLTGSGGTILNNNATAATLNINGSNAGGGATYSGTIANGSGTTGLRMDGNNQSGSAILAGANTYTGTTTAYSGILKAGIASVAGVSGAFGKNSAMVFIARGSSAYAIVDLNGYDTQIGSLTGGDQYSQFILGAKTLTVGGNNTSPAAFAGVISGSGGMLTKIGTGTLALSGTNTFSGGTIVNAGTLTGTGASPLGATTGALTVNNPNTGAGTAVVLNLSTTAATTTGTLSGTLAVPSSLTNTATINNGGQLFTVNQTSDATYAGVIAGTGGFTLGASSTNKLTLAGTAANTYLGTTTVSAGTLSLNKLNSATATQAIAGGGLTIGTATVTPATVQYAASSTNPDMMGTGAVTINGKGQLDFNGTTDTIGSVSIVATGAGGATTPITNTAGSGTLTIGTLGITPLAGYLSTIATGTGTLKLGGTVTFNAATTGQAEIAGKLDLNGTRTFNIGAGSGTGYDLNLTALVTNGTLDKAGDGTLILNGSSGYTQPNGAALTVSAGTVQFKNVSGTTPWSLANYGGPALTVNGGTVDLNGSNVQVGKLTGSGGTILNNSATAATLIINGGNAAGGGNYSGAIANGSGITGLRMDGNGPSGIAFLAGANTYTGTTTSYGGNLKAGVASVAGVSGAFGMNSAMVFIARGLSNYSTVDLNGYDTRIGSLTGGDQYSQFILGAKTLTVGGDNTSPAAFAGVISGSGGALTKIGTGTLILSGANSYSGNTVVQAGTLALTAASGNSNISASTKIIVGDSLAHTSAVLNVSNVSGGFQVKNGQTLAGYGSVTGGPVTINSGAIHAPGGSVGVQTVANNLTYASASIFEWELNGNTNSSGDRGAAGGYDAVDVTGSLAIDGTAATGTIFKIVLGSGVTADPFWTNPLVPRTWSDIFSYTSLVGSFNTSNIQVTGSGASAIGGGSFSISGTALTWTPVPEPSTALAGLLLGAGLLRRRR